MPKIITGHTGTPHITSDDVGALFQKVIGESDYLLSDTPETFTATLLDNNEIQLSDAEVVLQGTHIRILSTDSVTISQGQTGMKRIDLIVCRYTRTQEGIENAEIDVVQGTPDVSASVVPDVTQGDIRNGALLNEMALFSVELNGYSIEAVTQVCSAVNSLHSVESNIDTIKTNNLLWTGAHYMLASQAIEIPSIASQTNGIVLVFTPYESGAALNHNFHSFFVPKGAVAKHGGGGWHFSMFENLFSKAAAKYLYISDKKITGNDNNKKSGTGASGIAYDNSRFVLRYVFGV